MSSEDDSIEQAVASRRERLRALKDAQELMKSSDDGPAQVEDNKTNDDNGTDEEQLKFRNYLPQDKLLQEGKLAPAVLPKFEDPVTAAPPAEKNEDPFVNIAPKKPNWDLKRDVQKKLDKLERRTQKALYKFMELQEKAQKQLTEDEGDDANGREE